MMNSAIHPPHPLLHFHLLHPHINQYSRTSCFGIEESDSNQTTRSHHSCCPMEGPHYCTVSFL